MYDDAWARDFARKLEAALGAPERAYRRPVVDRLTDRLRQIDQEHASWEAKQDAKWEADRPMRERAEAAYRAANLQRRAELGLGPPERVPIAAALWTVAPSERRNLIF